MGEAVNSPSSRLEETDSFSLLPRLRAGGQVDEQEFGPVEFDQRTAMVRDVSGDRFGQLELNILMQGLAVMDDGDAGIARHWKERGFENDIGFQSPMAFVGSAEDSAETMQAHRERFGIFCYAVFQHHSSTRWRSSARAWRGSRDDDSARLR